MSVPGASHGVNERVVYIVDDNDEFRESASFWLQGAGYEIRSWGDAREAIEALAVRPAGEQACLLLDVRMPQMSGLDLHDALDRRGIVIPIVYMSAHADVPIAVKAMEKGAVTFLEKPFDDDALGSALDRAFAAAATARGHGIASQTGGAHTEHERAADGAPGDPADDEAHRKFLEREASLTPRELEVLTMVSHGTYNKVIADRIGLSVKTVELYRARGFAKMRVRSVAELTRLMVSRRA